MKEVEEKKGSRKSSKEMQFLIFVLGGNLYAINVLDLERIVSFEKITKVPDLKPCIEGVYNYQGSGIVVLDLSDCFGLKEKDAYNYIVITRNEDYLFGFLVNEARDVVSINKKDVRDVADNIAGKVSLKLFDGVFTLDTKKNLKNKKENDTSEKQTVLILNFKTMLKNKIFYGIEDEIKKVNIKK